MAKLDILETKLATIFIDKAPKLSTGFKRFVTEYSPWLALLNGILALLTAIQLWRWAHVADSAVNYAKSLCTAYASDAEDCATISDSRFSFWIWFAIAVLLVEAVLFLIAFPGLRDRRRQGWLYLFYAGLLHLAYAIGSLFTEYNAIGTFLLALITSAIGFWVLFQIRDAFHGAISTEVSSATVVESARPTKATKKK